MLMANSTIANISLRREFLIGLDFKGASDCVMAINAPDRNGTPVQQVCLYKFINVTIQDSVNVSLFKLGPGILDQPVRCEHIIANLRAKGNVLFRCFKYRSLR